MVQWFAKYWMQVKRWRSRRKDRGVLHSALPELSSVQAIASYVTTKLTYTGDPVFGGLDDYYNHPEYLQYCIESLLHPPVDCDDYSAMAYALAKKNPNLKPTMIVLLIKDLPTILKTIGSAILKFKMPYLPFHEGCLIEEGGKLYFVDTSGLWQVESIEELAERFGKAWSVPYTAIITEYPW